MREHRARFIYSEFGRDPMQLVKGRSGAAPLHMKDLNRLGSGGAGGAVFEKGGELLWIGCGRKTGLAGADDGDRLIGWEMRQGFLKRTGEMRERGAGRDAQD